MRVPVAVAQVPVCWSVRRNVGTVLAEAATDHTEIVRHTIDLAAVRDGYLSQQRADLSTVRRR